MIHRNSISALAFIIYGLAFVSKADAGSIPTLKYTFSNDRPPVLPIAVCRNSRVPPPLSIGEELPAAEVFFHEAFLYSLSLTQTERRN